MGHDRLREDKNCENCGHTVELTYCPNCGQKNVETRQSFGHLITHFIEDFTHYEGAFWKTIKYLLLRPGTLTLEYLAGRRQKFVAPVKLYIFISFVTFLLFSISFGDGETEGDDSHNHEVQAELEKQQDTEKAEPFAIQIGDHSVTNIRQLDSLQNVLPADQRLGTVRYWIAKKELKSNQKFGDINTNQENFWDEYFHYFPKVLFIFLPVFAFWFWVFHSKKKWYFFDHGIYTLHYFSFLLLSAVLVGKIIDPVLSYIFDDTVVDFIPDIFNIFYAVYLVYYYFRMHWVVFKGKLAGNFFKALAILVVNVIFLAVIFIISLFFVALNT